MINVNRTTLPNGLRIIHNYDPATSMVALDVMYDVGSRDEDPELTGMAHLFEHLMFGGSRLAPAYDETLERAGGWSNAWTSPDFTNFYAVAPATNAETLFFLESDRMDALALTPEALEVQRGVVTEEFRQTHLNQPYGDLGHLLRGLLYRTHPYRWPAIGLEPSHLGRVTLGDLESFYHSHYAPNNAVVSVSGNLGWDATVEMAEKWFGRVPRRGIAPRLYKPEPLPSSPRLLEVERAVPQTVVLAAYPMQGHGGMWYREADMATDILASGRSSRMFRRFVMGGGLFTEAEASISGSDEPGYLMLSARLTADDDASVARALAQIKEEALRLAEPGNVTERELERAKNRYESEFTFSSMSYLDKAQGLARAEMQGDDLNSMVRMQRQVTARGVAEAVAEIMRPEREATLIYRRK